MDPSVTERAGQGMDPSVTERQDRGIGTCGLARHGSPLRVDRSVDGIQERAVGTELPRPETSSGLSEAFWGPSSSYLTAPIWGGPATMSLLDVAQANVQNHFIATEPSNWSSVAGFTGREKKI